MSLQNGIEVIKSYLPTLENVAGVYRMLDENGQLLYIGKAKNLPKRVVSYTKGELLPYRLQRMVSLTKAMEFIVCKTEVEALLLEADLIRKLQPKFNIDLKDDKSFPYILLTSDKEFNMLQKFRGKKEADGYYFGPFFSTDAVYKTLHSMQRAFPLRTCSDSDFASRTRPCLEYQIKRCSAPCVGKISKPDYDKITAQAKAFLQGKNSDIQQELATQMQAAAENMEYEKAASLRDRINALTRIQNEHKITTSGLMDADVIALVNDGGMVAVQVFFIRAGQNMGNRVYYPASGTDDASTLEDFLMLFYGGNVSPAPLLLLNIEVADVVAQALKTTIETPQRGDKHKAVQMAVLNAKDALRRKLAEDATQIKLLKLMAERFGLEAPPQRIEVYDNSHNQGSNALGAMIVVTPNGFDKKAYRKFNIKTAQTNDDFAMMREVLTRRFANAAEEGNLPDVVLIDGGLGQLSAAHEAMGNLPVKIIAISKGVDRNAGNEEYHMYVSPPLEGGQLLQSKSGRGENQQSSPLSLPPHQIAAQSGSPSRGELTSFRLEHGSELAFFMQRIRDEAHRFVITGHRAKAAKNIKKSALDEVAGIGGVRKKALLAHFGSVADIKTASVDDLMKVGGINKTTAEVIYNHFH